MGAAKFTTCVGLGTGYGSDRYESDVEYAEDIRSMHVVPGPSIGSLDFSESRSKGQRSRRAMQAVGHSVL
jgi:hypothetical protein